MKEAMLYEKQEHKAVQCMLCSHYCTIRTGNTGTCGVRENREGRLFSLVYGQVSALALDPIEKKPLFHFYPGTQTFSLATVGCNFKCGFCQNASISQAEPGARRGPSLPPGAVVQEALGHGSKILSYTYSEPTVFFEYAYDTGKAGRARGLRNVFVTNGFMSAESRAYCAEFLDAANIDLKFFSDDTYRAVAGGRLSPVLDNIRAFHGMGVFLEITTLVVPGLNDSDAELKAIADFIVSVNPLIPWHVSAFHPDHHMRDRKATRPENIERALEIGLTAGLKHVYAGNVRLGGRENTACAGCGRLLVRRSGYARPEIDLRRGKCPGCGTPLSGRFE